MKNYWLDRKGKHRVLRINVFYGKNADTADMVFDINMEKEDNVWCAVMGDQRVPMEQHGVRRSLTQLIGPMLDETYWDHRITKCRELSYKPASTQEGLGKLDPKTAALAGVNQGLPVVRTVVTPSVEVETTSGELQ